MSRSANQPTAHNGCATQPARRQIKHCRESADDVVGVTRDQAALWSGIGLNELFGGTSRAISVSPSGLWVEAEDA